MSVDDAKRALAARATQARQAAHAAGAEAAPGAVRDHLLACLAGGIGVRPGVAVAGYWPVGDELDTRPLMAALDATGYVCALPVVTECDPALVFRRWRRDDALAAGRYGIMQPHAGAARITPDVVLTPLLAFDATGYRLGYGAGYYDRTLRRLRMEGNVTAIGICYAAQAVDDVPHDGGDERLDWIVTEDGAAPTGA